MPTIQLVIKGKVQGVFYRATAKEVAEKIGLTGWVKNTEEGHVQILASGSAEQLRHFTNWCKQGPPKAIVSTVETTELPEQSFDRFRVLR